MTVQIDWRDAGDASLGVVQGSATPIVVGEYVKLVVTATSPALTTYARTYIAESGSAGWDGTQTGYLGQATVHEGASTDIIPSLRIVGDVDMRVKLSFDDFDPGGQGAAAFFSRWDNTTGLGKPFTWQLDLTGTRSILYWSDDDSTSRSTAIAYAFALDTVYELRLTATAGATTNAMELFVDGVSQGTATATPAFGMSPGKGAPLVTSDTESQASGGSRPHSGDFYWGELRDGIDGPVVARVDADKVASPYAGYTDDERGSVWTVARSATGLVSTFVDRDMWLFSTDDLFSVADHDDLDFDETESFTLLALARLTHSHEGIIAGKKNWSGGNGAAYVLYVDGSDRVWGSVGDAGSNSPDQAFTLTEQTDMVVGFVRNVADDDVEGFRDGVMSGTPVVDASTGTSANALDFTIGATGGTPAKFFEGEIMAVVLWDRALTDAEIVQAGAELTTLPAEELGRHGDALLHYLKENYEIESGEVISALNEFNGITTVGRKEYKRARDTAFGL
jgi:hypothetical protein